MRRERDRALTTGAMEEALRPDSVGTEPSYDLPNEGGGAGALIGDEADHDAVEIGLAVSQ